MQYRDESLRRAARAFLCAEPHAAPQALAGQRVVIGGWNEYVDPQSHALHMCTNAYTPVSYALSDAIARELGAIGLKAGDMHRLHLNGVAEDHYLLMADSPTFDGQHLQGYSVTLSRSTFDRVLAPQLERWRSEARGASIV